MSRQLVSRADQLFNGRATFAPYQADKPGSEVTLTYRWRPSGNLAAAFTAGITAGVTTGTLTGNWAGASGLFPITFSDTEVLRGLFTNGSTAVTFYPASAPATGGSYGVPTGPVNTVLAAITVAGQPPALGVSNSIAASQSITIGPGLINGALATGGVATLDVPRNVIAAWTGTSILTIVGTDMYGQTQSEVSASGTSFTGKKTYATITAISVSANVTAATVGTGNVLGLPFRLASGDFFSPMFGDAADAGTFVAADVTSPATTSTGDVRGTYVPAGTLNNATVLSAILKVYDNTTQVGSFGVTPV